MEWIKVSPETMPPGKTLFMATVCDVSSGKKYFLKDIAYHPIANYYTYTTDGATSRMLCPELKVTHWMPYPEPAEV